MASSTEEGSLPKTIGLVPVGTTHYLYDHFLQPRGVVLHLLLESCLNSSLAKKGGNGGIFVGARFMGDPNGVRETWSTVCD